MVLSRYEVSYEVEILAAMFTAVLFIRAVATVIVMVTAPSTRNTLVITTAELRLRAATVHCFCKSTKHPCIMGKS